MEENRILTFEKSGNDTLEVHLNDEGLEYLVALLNRFAKPGRDEPCHEHLMTKAWGAGELSDQKVGESNKLVQQVSIYYWPE